MCIHTISILAAFMGSHPRVIIAPNRPSTRPARCIELQMTIDQRISESDTIPNSRREELGVLAAAVREAIDRHEPASLLFICTHNSRRSHMSQIWAAVAAHHFGFDNVHTYSGGTESTAFNPRAVAAMRRAGFRIDKTTDDANPIYHVRYADDAAPLTCFSKVYDHAPNPKKDFVAVMTCDSANEACPIVRGAARRIAIMYEDPKVADDTPGEAAKYDERCRQIGREMLYVFSLLATRS